MGGLMSGAMGGGPMGGGPPSDAPPEATDASAAAAGAPPPGIEALLQAYDYCIPFCFTCFTMTFLIKWSTNCCTNASIESRFSKSIAKCYDQKCRRI